MNIKLLIEYKDYSGIESALKENPALANEGIPYDEKNTTKAHPLHRICDAVYSKRITDEESVELAKIFLKHGADVNGNNPDENKDSPLVAAASLHADGLALLYIDSGADIHHAGCHGGTALHWAAWCGRDKVVKKLINAGGEINRRCKDFISTPLFWAIHGLKNGGPENIKNQVACAKLLVEAGADKTIPNIDGNTPFDLLNDQDTELKDLLRINY